MRKTIQYIACIFAILFTTNVLAIAAIKHINESRGVFKITNGIGTARPDGDNWTYLPINIEHETDSDKNYYIVDSGVPCLATYEKDNEYDLWHKGWFLNIYKTEDDSKPYKRVCATLGVTDATAHAKLYQSN